VPPPVLPTDLVYAQRPDARGQARVELPFASNAPQVRVYYTTETTALRGLELRAASGESDAAEAAAAFTEITQAPIGSARAQAFGNHKNLLRYDMFENLTAAPFPAGTAHLFPHALSGSLEGLALYRVISVAPSGVQSDFQTSPIVAAMVPNFGPPARPMLQAEFRAVDQGGGVRLHVRVPASKMVPVAFRVRRSTEPYPDTRQMLPVNSGDLAALGTPAGSWLETLPVTDDQGMTFTLVDPGPFDDWRRYFWSVEVQAGPPPGAPTSGFVPAGEWSTPSATANLDVIPSNPPGALANVAAQHLGADAVVTITTGSASRVVGTKLGVFRVEVFRVAKGARPIAVAGNVEAVSATEFTITDTDAPTTEVKYAARVVDALGRAGTLTLSNTLV
jgi:hypothetical protein